MNTRALAGFTVIELVLAMAVTALVGLSVAGAAMALSTSYEQGETYQDYVQTARSTSLQMQGLLRRAKLVTSCTGTSMVIWTGDRNGDSQINLTELVRISYDPASKELHQTQLNLSGLSALTAAVIDVVASLSSAMDDGAVRTLLETTYKAYRDDRLLAENVRSAEFRLDSPAPTAHRVSIRIEVGDSQQNLVIQPAVTLRSPSTDKVGIANHVYILLPGVL